MQRKTKKNKPKKYILALSEREVARLGIYADKQGVTRPVALQRIVKQAIRQLDVHPGQQSDPKQLGLFDTVQIDIFDRTTMVKNSRTGVGKKQK
jgi:hypothetical protein